MITKNKQQKTKLEEQYEELFETININPLLSDDLSLAQPSPMKPIMGIVTYGTNEEPILGEP